MRRSSIVVVASVIGLMLASTALAQPRPYDGSGRYQSQQRGWQGQDRSDDGQYYYDGRWVDSGEWGRHSSERDRWARRHHGRYGDRYRRGDDSSAIAAGIIGFALGAAIVGSQQDAERARRADESWDARCGRRYRSYDRSSRTYLGGDGMRHYCQG